MVQIKQILETALYVKDIDESERFYQVVLGLETYARQANRHVFFKIGETMLLLFNADECRKEGSVPGHGMEGQGHVAFSVQHQELDIWRKRLRDEGVAIEQEIKWPSGGQSIYFRDPDKNSVELATPDTWL